MGSGLLRSVGRNVTTQRHRLPGWLDRTVERAKWASVKRPPGLYVPPPLTTAAGERARVLIAPANFAGQGWQWAQALGRAGVPTVAWAYSASSTFAFPADHAISLAAANTAPRAQQRAAFERVVETVDAVVLEAGRPIFGAMFGFDPVAEARALQERGVRVALLWHGTDIRVPSQHAATHGTSPYALSAQRGTTRALEAVALRNRQRLASFSGPVLVSTPDLVPHVPRARWCPVVVDTHPAQAGTGVFEGSGPPTVVHIPSNPWLKGTELIHPTLDAMQRAGQIRYRSATGLTSREVGVLVASADVVLDQFRLGIYGVGACEALVAGRVVVSDVDDEVRETVRASTGLDLPIVQSSATELGDRLCGLIDDPAAARELAARGPGFVAEVHDGRRAASVLRDALDV